MADQSWKKSYEIVKEVAVNTRSLLFLLERLEGLAALSHFSVSFHFGEEETIRFRDKNEVSEIFEEHFVRANDITVSVYSKDFDSSFIFYKNASIGSYCRVETIKSHFLYAIKDLAEKYTAIYSSESALQAASFQAIAGSNARKASQEQAKSLERKPEQQVRSTKKPFSVTKLFSIIVGAATLYFLFQQTRTGEKSAEVSTHEAALQGLALFTMKDLPERSRESSHGSTSVQFNFTLENVGKSPAIYVVFQCGPDDGHGPSLELGSFPIGKPQDFFLHLSLDSEDALHQGDRLCLSDRRLRYQDDGGKHRIKFDQHGNPKVDE